MRSLSLEAGYRIGRLGKVTLSEVYGLGTFPLPTGGQIAVKVINHLGDEVIKVIRVE
jgi:hypothetical protein